MADMKTLTINGKKFIVADPDAAHIDDSSVGSSAWSSNKISDEISKVSEEITRKHDTTTIIREAEGEVISVKDSSDDNLHGLKLFGKTTQRTTTGKNLLKNAATTQTVNGVTFTANSDGSIIVNGTCSGSSAQIIVGSMACTANTQYILSGCPSGGTDKYWLLTTGAAGIDYGSGVTFHYTEDKSPVNVSLRIELGVACNNLIFYPMVRLASNKDATYEPYTGGIPAPNPEYPQELVSPGKDGNVAVTACGKNLLDVSKFTNQYYTADGKVGDLGNFKLFKDFIPVKAGDVLSLSAKYLGTGEEYLRWALFDTEKVFLSRGNGSAKSETAVINISQDGYIRVFISYSEYDADTLQLERNPTATEYEPYKGHTLTALTPNGLPGIPVTSGGNYTDENGQQWICDEVDFEKGKYVQRLGNVMLDGTEPWTYHSASGLMHARILSNVPAPIDKSHNGMCSHYKRTNATGYMSIVDGEFSIGMKNFSSGNTYLFIKDQVHAIDVETWKAYLANQTVKVLYTLATPVERDLTAEQIAAYKAMHTNKPNTLIYNDAGVYMEASYNADAEIYIDDRIAERTPRNHHIAPAIVENAMGEVISVSDSSDDYVRGLKLFGKTTQLTTTGKNLLNLVDLKRIYAGCTGVVKNGVVTVTGTVTDTMYTLWLLGGYDETDVLFTLPVGTYTAKDCFLYSYDGATRVNKTGTFTVTEPFVVTAVLYKQFAVGTVVNETGYPQVEIGSVATEWEPYTGGIPSPNPDYPQELESVGADGNVAVTVCGKNLLNNFQDTWTSHGITFTKNADGSVKYSGTSTDGAHAYYYGMGAMSYANSIRFKAGSYIFSAGNNAFNVLVRRVYEDGTYKDIVSALATGSFTLEQDCNIWATCLLSTVVQGQSYSGTIYPMIRPASIADAAYEPYKEAQTLTALTPNSLPGIPVSSGGNYTDEKGQQWICDEIDFASGKYVQRVYSHTFTDSDTNVLVLGESAAGNSFTLGLGFTRNHPPILFDDTIPCVMSDIAIGIACNNRGNKQFFSVYASTGDHVIFRDSTENTVDFDAFKAGLSGKKIAYALATPIERDLTANELAQYSTPHTNYPNTTVYNDSGAGMEVEYVADTKTYIDKKFAELAAAIVNNA